MAKVGVPGEGDGGNAGCRLVIDWAQGGWSLARPVLKYPPSWVSCSITPLEILDKHA